MNKLKIEKDRHFRFKKIDSISHNKSKNEGFHDIVAGLGIFIKSEAELMWRSDYFTKRSRRLQHYNRRPLKFKDFKDLSIENRKGLKDYESHF